MDDGRTPDQRRCGNTWKRPVVEFGESVHFRPVGENNALRGGDQRLLQRVCVGHHERSGAAIFLTPDEEGNENCENVGARNVWQLRPDHRNLVRPVVLVAEADQGVAPVIVMPAVLKTDRSRYVTKRDLVKYGYTDECQACTQSASGMHNARVPHDDRCRDRIGELMAGDDDQRQVECLGLFIERLKSRVWEPEKRWTLANRRMWKINNQFPQFEWVDHQVQESSWIRFKSK